MLDVPWQPGRPEEGLSPSDTAIDEGAFGRATRRLGFALVAAVFVVGAFAVGPLRDVPVVDDWTYAWSVDHLLRTGELRIAEISAVYPVLQVLWGALFVKLFGFSFGVLRLSTVVVGIAGCWALYLTLRELRCGAVWSLLGALALAVHPVYFAFTFSFMTDVPATALTLVSILFAVQAIERDRPSRLWGASAFAVAAFLVRATAGVIPFVLLAVVDWRRRDRARWAVPILAGLAAIVVGWIAVHRLFGALGPESGRLEQLAWLTLVLPRNYVEWNFGVLWQAAIAFAPLLLAATCTRRWLPVTLIAAALAALLWAAFGHLPATLPDWDTWSMQDVGGGRVLILGMPDPSAWSERVRPIVLGLGMIAGAALFVSIVSSAAERRRAVALVLVLGAVNLAVVNALWLYNDRYYLPLAPTLACAAALWAARVRAPAAVASVLIALLWIVAVTGTRDMLDVNETVARAAADLETAGVPAWDIDAGWALNGWRLWAHPERLAPGATREYGVPFVTSKTPTSYAIASVLLPDHDVVRVLPLPHSWWQATDRIYVLRRRRLPRQDF
ncbi:MAG TPA: glycosyltransferase family 39 protein [Vicinamibacterales bacterium]